MKIFLYGLVVFMAVSTTVALDKRFVGGSCTNQTNTRCEVTKNRMTRRKCWQPSRICSRPPMEKCWCQLGTPQVQWKRCAKEYKCTADDITTPRSSTVWTTTTVAPSSGVFLAWWQIIVIATAGGVMALCLLGCGLGICCKYWLLPKLTGVR